MSLYLKYLVVGGVGTIIHFSVLVALVELLSINATVSTSIGFIAALVISFFMNAHWTFAVSVTNFASLLRYTAVSVVGLLLNAGIMFVTNDWLRLNYVIGFLLAFMVVPPSNFLMNRYWTFRNSVRHG